ncbi:glycosyltransferase family 39 protein [Arthrobacter zhaoxinii]|uniref:glycosyltransferase family 39 protein n=1 Tax=Arthrobacter zhaoxinii TaxID=2964616 RepID=UPI0021047381|nr:glycosyltransferase family 39 protein [Arthrobacter zhaoxinii]MCQ2001764.1 glycosyltransferase family 39 protein [Arthrobacter zhaoxinii]
MSETRPEAAAFPRPVPGTGWLFTPAVIAAGAFAVSVLGSWHASLWTDEAVSISAASRSWSSLLKMLTDVDAVHGAYYALMHLWGSVFGYSAFALRLPSALAVGAAAAGVYVVARRLDGPRTAAAAAVIFAILPRTTWMGMEGRSFALGTAAGVGLACLLAAGVIRGRWMSFAGYGLLAAFGIAVNIYVLLAVAGHGLTLLLIPRARPFLGRWLAAAVGGGLLAAPVLLASAAQSGQLGTPDLSALHLARNVLVDQWFLGETPTNASVPGSGDGWWQPAALLLALPAWLLALKAARSAGQTVLAAAAPLVLLPTVVLVAYSLVVSPIYNPRYLAIAVPGLALLMGAGLVRISTPGRRIAAWAVLGMLILPVYASQRTESAKSASDWSRVAAYVEEHSDPGDAVYFGPRRPPDGTYAGQTQRRIRTAYPAPFRGLVDLTLIRPGEDDGSLDGRSLRLQDAAVRLKGIDRLVAVRRVDYPAALLLQEEQWLASSGFAQEQNWTGTTNRITVFIRVE